MSDRHRHLWPGVPFALGSAVLFGLSAPVSKLLIGGIDPWLLAGILYLGAGLGLAAVHYGRHGLGIDGVDAPLRHADIPWLLAVILFGGVLGPLCLMLGLSLTAGSTASLLLNIEGLATMAIAWIVFRESVDGRLLLGAGAILLGAVVLSWNGSGGSVNVGSFWIVAACISWGIDNNLTRKLSSADPVQIAMIKGLSAGVTNTVLALYIGAVLPAPPLMMSATVVGFLGIGVSLVLFMIGLRHLGTARTGAYFSAAPFVGALASLFLFDEGLSVQFSIAGALMALGICLHVSERHEHDHEHEVLEHEHMHVHDEHHRHDHEGPVTEPHSHWHRHEPMRHKHLHFPDLHHRHSH